MNRNTMLVLVALLCMAALRVEGKEQPDARRQASLSRRCAPAGGWLPDNGGLITWWPACCFPCCGIPDDYCPKPLPQVCWPPYSAEYRWVSSNPCCPNGEWTGQSQRTDVNSVDLP